MLELKDFIHLPQLDALIDQLIADRPGLVLVAGLDPRPAATPSLRLAPSGRSAFFGILVRRLVAAHRRDRAVVIAENKDAVRLPRGWHGQIERRVCKPPLTYTAAIEDAVRDDAQVLVVDQLNNETAGTALKAAKSGRWVISQLDCVFCGAAVAQHLLDLGAAEQALDGLRWVISVQRLPTLCPHCKQAAEPRSSWLDETPRDHADESDGEPFYRASGCSHCRQTGRQGDVAIFDVFRAPEEPAQLFEQASALPLRQYALALARLGHVSIDDVEHLETEQLRRTFLLLTASEQALAKTNADLRRRLAELEVAQRILEQRTDSLISLQEIAHTLITSTELDDLVKRISRFGHKLCGADKSVLYIFQSDGAVEIVSVNGWDQAYLHEKLDGMAVLGSAPFPARLANGGPSPYNGYPPGIPALSADLAGEALRAGLRVPLIAQNEVVGLMIVHSTRKTQFTAGEIALLQTFANQAALAIQRTGLVEELRHKVELLTAAQAELVQKERLESELELARQVQQSLLPRHFPEMPGYAFAARNETARRVGGDFYDAFQLDGHHFGLVIADVSDKGMPAALFMALTRSLLLAEARRELSPLKVLTNVHHLLLELGEPDMFVTVFYGVVDTDTQELTYVRAGHEEPFLLRAGAVQRLVGKGGFLGLLESQEKALSEETRRLAPGDRLVLYTDGIADALSPEEEAFGIERFRRLLESHGHLSPDKLCEKIFDAVTAHRGATEQFDDMAVLIVEIEGEGAD